MQAVKKAPRKRNGPHSSLYSVVVAYHGHVCDRGIRYTRYLNSSEIIRYMRLRKCAKEIVKL